MIFKKGARWINYTITPEAPREEEEKDFYPKNKLDNKLSLTTSMENLDFVVKYL